MNVELLFSVNHDWKLYLNFPNQKKQLIKSFDFKKVESHNSTKYLKNCVVKFELRKENGYWFYIASVTAKDSAIEYYFSISKEYDQKDFPYNFNQKIIKSEVFRQSPHEPADHEMIGLSMQPIPMVGLFTQEGFEVVISDTPAYFDNYTTQIFDVKNRVVDLSSGDNGAVFDENSEMSIVESLKRKGTKKYSIESHFFKETKQNSHKMSGLMFTSKGKDISDLRMQVNENISKHWTNGRIKDKLGSTLFSTAYMNLRVNETCKSKYWVIPAIDYANKQYSRDAFWISMILPDSISQSCYENEASYDTKFIGAERQLFTIVWAYRNYLKGFNVDTFKIRKILSIVEKQASSGYYSGFGPSRKAGCWQGWGDDLAFDETDAITNNQGLYVVALKCAEKMGIKPTVSISQALINYQRMFNSQINGFAISKDKDSILCVDALMGDLLAQVYLGQHLIAKENVLAHFETMKKYAKTDYGFKCFCNSNGSYLKTSQYNSSKYTAAVEDIQDGTYQFGGSWYLYDMQMLMDAYLAGAKDAKDLMIWRTKLEFDKGNTTHEYINTTTGISYKPNMGWNAGVYGLWTELLMKGIVKDSFFNEINGL